MQFTMEEEKDNSIHFRYITISRSLNSLKFDIYSKPTATDTTTRKHSPPTQTQSGCH
jgi:hypothetical protein